MGSYNSLEEEEHIFRHGHVLVQCLWDPVMGGVNDKALSHRVSNAQAIKVPPTVSFRY